QNFGTGDHPSPRAIRGPRRFVTESGSRFQRAMRAIWRELVGSVSRGSTPGAVQLAYSSGKGSNPQFFLNAYAPLATFERPKSNWMHPRRRACRISSKYIRSLARRDRAMAVPPPQYGSTEPA